MGARIQHGQQPSGILLGLQGGPLLHDTDVGARYRQGPGARDFDVRLRASEGAGPESSRLVEGSGLWSDRPGLAVEFSVRGLLTKGRWLVLRRSMRVGSDGELEGAGWNNATAIGLALYAARHSKPRRPRMAGVAGASAGMVGRMSERVKTWFSEVF